MFKSLHWQQCVYLAGQWRVNIQMETKKKHKRNQSAMKELTGTRSGESMAEAPAGQMDESPLSPCHQVEQTFHECIPAVKT